MAILLYAVSFVLLMGLVVVAHEFGHYYAARTLGVSVARFSFGFGPCLFSREDRAGCKWQVRAYPFGGYVAFKEDAGDADPRACLRRRPPLDRAYVLVAGPAASLLLGLGLMGAIYVAHGRAVTPPVLAKVLPGKPAAVAGMLAGDRILSVDGQPVAFFEDASRAFEGRVGKPVDVEVSRDGAPKPLRFVVTPEVGERTTFGVKQAIGVVGVKPVPRVVKTAGPLEGLSDGFRDVLMVVRESVKSVVATVTGQAGLRDMGGPVKVAAMSGAAAQAGFLPFLVLVAAMSINLGIFNLLPLPVLDGGQIFACVIEILSGRPVPERTLHWVNSFGFAFLMSLALTVTISDVWGLVGN